MKSTLLISLMMAFSLQAFAEGELKNFTPGTYSLKQGKLMECGAGDFAVRDSGTNVGLGDLHGFDLKNATGSLPGDAPGDEGCIYETKNTIETEGAKTVLTFTETRKCKDVVRHVMTKRAELQDGKVQMDVKQTGKPVFHYSCRWTKNAAKK